MRAAPPHEEALRLCNRLVGARTVLSNHVERYRRKNQLRLTEISPFDSSFTIHLQVCIATTDRERYGVLFDAAENLLNNAAFDAIISHPYEDLTPQEKHLFDQVSREGWIYHTAKLNQAIEEFENIEQIIAKLEYQFSGALELTAKISHLDQKDNLTRGEEEELKYCNRKLKEKRRYLEEGKCAGLISMEVIDYAVELINSKLIPALISEHSRYVDKLGFNDITDFPFRRLICTDFLYCQTSIREFLWCQS